MEEVLTVDQVVSFNQAGVLVVPGFYDLSEVDTPNELADVVLADD